MDVIEIGKTHLIFLLSEDEMKQYNIDTDIDSPLMRDSFSKLVNDLGFQNDFSSGVLVQIFDSKNGGCEMFVTKLPDAKPITDEDTIRQKKHIYIYTTIGDLLLSCKLLSEKSGYEGALYYDREKNNYYLVLDFEWSYLGEFNAKKCRENTLEYLYEHCDLITERAVKTLSPLA